MLESVGGYGTSALCRYQLGADRPEHRAALDASLFGEGICRAGDVIWQLTWQERVALRWDADDPTPVADAALFLLSDLSRATTGEILHVDGGAHAIGAAAPAQSRD